MIGIVCWLGWNSTKASADGPNIATPGGPRILVPIERIASIEEMDGQPWSRVNLVMGCSGPFVAFFPVAFESVLSKGPSIFSEINIA